MVFFVKLFTRKIVKQRIIDINEMSNVEYMKLSTQARQSIPDFNLTTYCETLKTGKGQSLERKFAANLNGTARGPQHMQLT